VGIQNETAATTGSRAARRRGLFGRR